jgi:hypothetical protein
LQAWPGDAKTARQLANIFGISIADVTGDEIPNGLHVIWRSLTRAQRMSVWYGALAPIPAELLMKKAKSAIRDANTTTAVRH